jgi:hypothetical protein
MLPTCIYSCVKKSPGKNKSAKNCPGTNELTNILVVTQQLRIELGWVAWDVHGAVRRQSKKKLALMKKS